MSEPVGTVMVLPDALTFEHEGRRVVATVLVETHPAGLPDLIAATTDADCPRCHGSGLVCEEHPDLPWDAGVVDDCQCGGAGQPCACTGMEQS